MTQRKIKGSWLRQYLQYTEGQESPSMFHLWVGLSVMGCALERNVFLDRAYYILYPNLYIILVADSEVCMKTTAADIGINLLSDIYNVPAIFSQKITPEALVSALCNECSVDVDGHVYKNAAAVIYAEELSVFLGRDAYSNGMVSILTSLYSCKDKWVYETIGRGKDVTFNTCLNMLGATTPEWLRMSIPTDAVGGGFTSRIVFVYQYTSDRVIPHPVLTKDQKKLREELVHDLSIIRNIKGEIKFTPDAYEWYAKWYQGHRMDQEAGKDVVVRKKDMVLKLSIIFSMARSNELYIEVDDLQRASSALDANEQFLPEAMRILTSTPLGIDANRVATAIRKVPDGITHAELVRKFYYTLDMQAMNSIIETLATAKVIEVHIVGDTNERLYKYIDTVKKTHFADKFKAPMADL